MEDQVYIWNAENGGWLTEGHTYTSDINKATQIPWGTASTIVATAYNEVMKEFKLLPVRVSDVSEVHIRKAI